MKPATERLLILQCIDVNDYILFLRSDLSDQSDFAQNKVTKSFNKPRPHCCLFTFHSRLQHGRRFVSFY